MSNILITGATGDVGSKVVKQLLQLGHRPRVYVRDRAKAYSYFGNSVKIIPGDLAHRDALASALSGISSLFLITSGPNIPVLDEIAVQASKSASVQHIVKLSSIDVEQHLAIGAWHERGEAAIRASGIPFTFVRPTGFMSNLLAWTNSIRNEAVMRTSTGDGRRPFIHSEDTAAVTVEALLNGKYVNQALAITGPESLSFREIAAKISAALKKPIEVQYILDEEAGRRFSETGVSAAETEAHIELWQAIREGRLETVTDGVERVLGRKPIALDQWMAENAAAFS